MSMMTNTLGRYFAGRFVVAAVGVFASIFVLLVLVDYIEMVQEDVGAGLGFRRSRSRRRRCFACRNCSKR